VKQEKIRDFTLRITNANKTEMITILYDIGIVYMEDALACIDDDKPGFRLEIGRVRATLKELMNSVNVDDELGHNLLRLYIFLSEELTKSYLDYDKEPLLHVLSVFNRLSEAYKEAEKKDLSAPVMEHTEKVYSGFTYNKNSISENVSAAEVNRGYLV